MIDNNEFTEVSQQRANNVTATCLSQTNQMRHKEYYIKNYTGGNPLIELENVTCFWKNKYSELKTLNSY